MITLTLKSDVKAAVNAHYRDLAPKEQLAEIVLMQASSYPLADYCRRNSVHPRTFLLDPARLSEILEAIRAAGEAAIIEIKT
jgi:hypothetical protein